MLRRGELPPWRSKFAAYSRRKVLGIACGRDAWTEEENALLAQGLPVPGRSSQACQSRRKRIGLRAKRQACTGRSVDPTPDEIKERARRIREEREM